MLFNCGVREGSWESLGLQAHSKGNQSWYSLERLMLKLKLQYFGHLMQRANSLEKALILGKIEGGKRRGLQRTKWLDGITDLTNMSLSKLQEMVKDREAWHAAVHGVAKCWTRLSDWTTNFAYTKLYSTQYRLLEKHFLEKLFLKIKVSHTNILVPP